MWEKIPGSLCMHKFNFLFRSRGAWERSYYDTVRWSLQVSHGVLDSTFYHSIPSHVKTLHDTLDKYEVTNPYGLFRRYLFVLISRGLLVSNPEGLGLGIWVHDCEIVYVHVCTIFLQSDATANILSLFAFVWLLFEGGVYFFRKLADINAGWMRYTCTYKWYSDDC